MLPPFPASPSPSFQFLTPSVLCALGDVGSGIRRPDHEPIHHQAGGRGSEPDLCGAGLENHPGGQQAVTRRASRDEADVEEVERGNSGAILEFQAGKGKSFDTELICPMGKERALYAAIGLHDLAEIAGGNDKNIDCWPPFEE